MKLYKYLISGGLALTLSLSSCESWLEVEPNDTRTTDYFYSTPSEMEQAIIGIGYYWGNIATRARDMFRMNRIKDHFEYRKLNPEIEVAPGVFRKEAVSVSGTWNDSKMYLPRPFVDSSINPNLKN